MSPRRLEEARMRIQCPQCDARFRAPDDLEVGDRVKCPECGRRFPWAGEDEDPAAKPRKHKSRKAGGGFPVIPVVVGAAVLVGIVALVLATRPSKKADPDPATDTSAP